MADRAYLDEHRGYIGTSGSGKSTTARVDVELLLQEKRHVGIIDITGIWYGLRSDRAGTRPGFDIPIFGGRRGDVAIAAGDGRAIGKLVGDGISAIVDLSSLRDGAGQRAFMADFVAAIREKPPGHFQLVCDEADEYVPEKGGLRDAAHAQVAEDMIWIAKRGRTDGYVLSLITQRLADVANAAFSQVATIFAHNLIAPSDTVAFGKYVKAHGTKAEFDLIMKGLPGLQVGERFLYRPRLHFLERGTTPLPVTFDSSRTPGPGEARREPKMLSQIDVGAIAAALEKPKVETAMVAFAAGAEAGQLLHEKDARIRALEIRTRELEVEPELLRRQLRIHENLVVNVQLAVDDAREEIAQLVSPAGPRVSAGDEREVFPSSLPLAPTPAAGEAPEASANEEPRSASPDSSQREGASPAQDREHRALAVLAAALPLGLTEAAWAARAGYARKGGAWIRRRARYLQADLIEKQGNKWFATPAGRLEVGEELPDFPAPGPALVRFWAGRLGSAASRVLLRLADLYPQALSRTAIAAEVRMAEKGGAFVRAISEVKSAELVEERGRKLRVAPAIMGDER